MKIKKILILMLVLLCSTTLFACKDEQVKAELAWKESVIELNIGDEQDLGELITVTNGEKNQIVYTSLNQSIVNISNGKVVAVKEGKALVEAKLGDTEAYITVDVAKEIEKFEKALLVSFDKDTNTLKWNKAYKMVDGQPQYASNYVLNITKGQEHTQQTTTENYYAFTEVGDYSVTIISKNTNFKDSDETESVSFKIIATPSNLAFDKATKTLSWNGGEYSFLVKVNQTTMPVTTEKSVVLNFDTVGKYDITVVAVSEEFKSKPSEVLSITKLQTPTMTVSNGTLSFDRVQQNLATNYKISIKTALGDESFVDNNTGTYSFEDIVAGAYTAKVMAVGGENVIDSEYSQAVSIDKLASPVINFDKATKVVSVNVEGATLFIKNTVTEEIKQKSFSDLQYIFNEGVGIYQLYAVVNASLPSQINSDVSSSLYIERLSALTNLRHETAENISTLYFESVSNGDEYRVYVNDVPVEGIFDGENGKKITLESATDVLFDAGTKNVRIVSFDHEFDMQGSNYFVLSEDAISDIISVTRFATITPVYENGLTWSVAENCVCYEYELLKNGESFAEGQEESTSYSTSSLRFGNYKFKIKAVGDNSRYLTALDFGEVEFSIKETLTAPTLTFDHQTKKLTVGSVENADTYYIKDDENTIATLTSEDLTFDISALLTDAKEYNFYAWAVNLQNDADLEGNLFKSSEASVKIEKLICLSSLGFINGNQFVLDMDIYDGKTDEIGFELKINEELITDLSTYEFEGNQFVLKIKITSDKTSISPYYLDSDYSTFTLDRLATPTNIVFNDYVISWDAVENAANYICYVSKDGLGFYITLEENSVDLKENPMYFSYINSMGDGYSLNVVAVVSNQTIEKDDSGYFNSLASDSKTIYKLETPVLAEFVSQDADDLSVKIDWEDVENATSYLVTFDGVDSVVNVSEFIATNMSEVKSYSFKVKAINPSYIYSEYMTATLTRLDKITSVDVLENEVLDLNVDQTKMSGIKIDGTLAVLPFNLNEVTTTKQVITMQNIGKTVENTFFMSSVVTKFAFRRFEQMLAPTLADGKFSWEIVSDCDGYEILFTAGEDVEPLSIYIEAKSGIEFVNTLVIDEYQELVNFIEDSGSYNVQIKAVKLPYLHDEGENNVGYLSSEYSDSLIFEKLAVAQDLTVLAEDSFDQKNVTISWSAVIGADNYSVYLNNILLGNSLTNSLTTDKLEYTSEFTQNGEYQIQVVANAVGKISSEMSEKCLVKRLNELDKNSIQVTKTGIMSWGSSPDAIKYKTYISYEDFTSEIVESALQSYDYNELIYSSNYTGNISFYVCAVGDRVNFLSSKYSFKAVLKLEEPVIHIYGDHLIIDESALESNAKFNVVIKYKDSENVVTQLEEFVLEASTEYFYPEGWNEMTALADENGKFIFEVYSTLDNCINSELVTNEVSRVASGEFKGFTRRTENGEDIDLVVSVDSAIEGATYYLSIVSGGLQFAIDNIVPNEDNELIYPIKDELNSALFAGQFKLSFHISAPNFIDSNKAYILGSKLSWVTNLYVSKGELKWNRSLDSNCLAYLMRVSYGEETIYKKYNYDVLSEKMEGYSGKLIINIKCIGNINYGTYSLDNIVLDSNYLFKTDYDGAPVITDNNLTVYKLEKPTDIGVYFGDFKLLNPEVITSWTAVSGEFEYLLDGEIDEDGYFIGSSEAIYAGTRKLTENTLYNIKFQAHSDEENVLNSDFSDEIAIKVLPNPNNSGDSISFEWNETDVENYDISWAASELRNLYNIKLVNSSKVDALVYIRTYVVTTDSPQFKLNCDYFMHGSFDVSVQIVGSSSLTSDDFYYLSSNYSQTKRFYKLEEAGVEIKDGRLTWDSVDDADRYYIYYLPKTSDEDVNMEKFVDEATMVSDYVTTNYWNMPENFGSFTANSSYYFGIRAASSNQKYAPSQISGFGHIEGETKEDMVFLFDEVVKIKAPDQINLVDGTLLWNTGDYDYSLSLATMSAELNGGISPFVYGTELEALQDYVIVFRFVDTNGLERKYNISAVELFNAEVTKGMLFPLIADYLGLSEDYKFGWPVLEWLTDEIGTIAPGEYNMSLMQKGDDENWINSNYNSARNVYIPHAPLVSINNFVLSWNAVNLPVGKTLNNEKKYSVVTEDKNGKRTIVHQTNDLSVDLRTLVYSDKIVTGEYKVFVFVNGDNDYYINGLISNRVNIKVLPSVIASIEGGILSWDSVSQTNKYNIVNDCGNVNYFYEFETANTRWDMAELECFDNLDQRLTYNITIQCIGDGTNTISGKIADIGNVIKLITPQLNVVRGEFVWDNIEGNEGYTLKITTDNSEFSLVNLGKNRVTYESNVRGYNNYNIRAVGTTSNTLNSESLSYAISGYMTTGVNGVMLESIEGVGIPDGNMIWVALKDLNDLNVTGYKMSFGDVNFFNPVYIEDYEIIYIDGIQYVICELDENFVSGVYNLYFQAYTNTPYISTANGKTYKQLLGAINNDTTLDCSKLQTATNISTNNGVISWDANDSKSNNYILTFIKNSENYEFECKTNTWDASKLTEDESLIYANMLDGFTYKLKIRTLGNDEDLLNSDFSEEVSFNKLATINSIEYLEGTNEGFMIRWKFVDQVSGISNYNYAIRYDNGEGAQLLYSAETELIRTGYDSEGNFYWGEIDGSTLLGIESESLKYQICVIPVSESNMLVSDFSEERTVYPPDSLTGEFTYNSERRSISWIYNEGGSDVKFRIIDEIISINEENELVVEKTKTYLSQSTEFVLEEIGYHRISICVVLTGESVASSYVYFDYEVATDGLLKDSSYKVETPNGEVAFTLINFDLFESGSGTSENPFVVRDAEQFANINQRLSKPSYLGGEQQWTFILNSGLTISNATSIGAFGGIFDGANHTITYTISNQTNTRIGLFEKLIVGGTVKNLSLIATIHQENYNAVSELYISPFVVENNGLIYNCSLTSFTYTSELAKAINISFGSISAFNYGTIERCINNSSIVFDGINQGGVRNSNINVGGIAYTNGKSGTTVKIKECGNNGIITVYAKSIALGGLVAIHNNGASIESCFNKGSIIALVTQTGSAAIYIGGLVASSQELIKNSYTTCSIAVDMNNLSRTAYIGGLVGYISNTNGAVINNCYVSNKNITTTNASYSSCNIGLLVGYSNAQDTQSQTCSYYIGDSLISPIVGAPNGFTCQSYTSFGALLTNLNAQDYAFKANGTEAPKLLWE